MGPISASPTQDYERPQLGAKQTPKWGNWRVPIQQFSPENPFSINKSAVPNSTGPKQPYTAPVSCREVGGANGQSVQGMWFECDAEDVREDESRCFEENKELERSR
jgi:hypothetical protein